MEDGGLYEKVSQQLLLIVKSEINLDQEKFLYKVKNEGRDKVQNIFQINNYAQINIEEGREDHLDRGQNTNN
jgi:hypothetical protein